MSLISKSPLPPLFKGGKVLSPPLLKGDLIDRIPSDFDVSLAMGYGLWDMEIQGYGNTTCCQEDQAHETRIE